MSDHDAGRVAASAAEVYERFFVPALFSQWPDRLLDRAGAGPGDRVLDVACGTGVLARAAANRVGPEGRVNGLDVNPAMLAVAQAYEPVVSWSPGAAEALPFEDAAFDATLCQFGLMFFDDAPVALAEMLRVTRPGGRVVVAVWGALDDSPGYSAMARLLESLYDAATAGAVEAPFALGDTSRLQGMLDAAGVGAGAVVETVAGTARFSSLSDWLFTEIRGWTLADVLDDEAFTRLEAAAPDALGAYVLADGSVEFAAPAHLITIELPEARGG